MVTPLFLKLYHSRTLRWISLSFPARGRFEVTARLEPVPREVDTSNNTASREIEVEERKIKILLIEDPPRWDYRYLKDFLRRFLREWNGEDGSE